jgi:uncharacterized protein (TIGR04141 family)
MTVFLLKTKTGQFEDGLEEAHRLERHDLKEAVPFEGAIFIAPQRMSPPPWMDFLKDGAKEELRALFNASTKAVLFVRTARRVFAFTFGYGRTLLASERIQRSFGLRVVLNTVDEKSLLNVDSTMVQELTVHTRRQASRGSGLAQFSVDKEEDILGSVAGAPRDPYLGSIIHGADALRCRPRLKFVELGDLCRRLLRAYRGEDYKARGFEFVDHVRTVRDPGVRETLDADLVAAMLARDLDAMHMAPPEILDWATTDGFSFVKTADPEPDLMLESFFEQIHREDDLSPDRLRRQRVFQHLQAAAEPVKRWPVYRTIVADREHDGRRYVLSGGEWYEIDADFAEGIRRQVVAIRKSGLGLPDARPGEAEKEYNRRAAERRGLYCVDRKCPRVAGDAIELCDVYSSSGRQFVHVKRWTRSATLSHLFAQGLTSAEALVSDAKFRESARRLLGEQAKSLRSHIPAGEPDRSKYRIVYAVIRGGGRGRMGVLPFFSQLRLVRSAQSLRRLGFEVRWDRIGVER